MILSRHEAKNSDHQRRLEDRKVCRIVTLASVKGRYGGPYDTAGRQSQILQRLGCKVALVAGFTRQDRPGVSPEADYNVVLFPVWVTVPGTGFSGLFSLRALWSLTRQISKADVIHVSYARELVPLFSALIATVMRKKLILQPHGMLTTRQTTVNSIIDIIAVPLLKRADSVLALTSTEAEGLKSLAGLKPEVLNILGNPLPEGLQSPSSPLSAKSEEALFVGRLHPRKKVCDFVNAAEAADTAGLLGTYAVVGPDEGELECVLKSESNRISYEGAIAGADVTRRVSECSVFVLTSENEPWGNVLATAIALGKPTVVAKSSALAGEIQKYGAGILVEDGSPESIANAVDSLLGDESLYRRTSAGAIKMATELLAQSAQISALSEIYVGVETSVRNRQSAKKS